MSSQIELKVHKGQKRQKTHIFSLMRISFENFKVRQSSRKCIFFKIQFGCLKKTRLRLQGVLKKDVSRGSFPPLNGSFCPLFNDPVVLLWLKHFQKDKLPQFRNVDQPSILNIIITLRNKVSPFPGKYMVSSLRIKVVSGMVKRHWKMVSG